MFGGESPLEHGAYDGFQRIVDKMALNDVSMYQLREYLTFHEEDIACEINDFGDLADLFVEVLGRKAMQSNQGIA